MNNKGVRIIFAAALVAAAVLFVGLASAQHQAVSVFGGIGLTGYVAADSPAGAVDNVAAERSAALLAPAAFATFIVNSTGDAPDADLGDGVCSTAPLGLECTLRAAIEQANADAAADTINFAITGAGCAGALGVCTISPATALPPVSQPATINGYTQPGSSENSLAAGFNGNLRVELNGTGAPAGTDGLQITAGSTTVRGLIINRFKGDGIELSAAGGNTVSGNFIGTNADGTAAGPGNGTAAAGNAGIQITGGSANTVGGSAPLARNVISGNTGDGVRLTSTASANIVLGNYVGTDAGGTLDVGNTASGVSTTTAGNQIGDATTTPGQGAGNVISGNDTHGVAVVGAGTNEVQGNLIGLQSGGAAALPNTADGVNVTGAATGNLVGGPAVGLRNVISGNTGDGVELSGAGVTSTQVSSNYIGTDRSGTADLGNGANGVLITTGAASNTVGGLPSIPGASPGNVISGNQSDGVEINGSASSSNLVRGNIVGLDVNASAVIRNEDNGVLVSAAPSNTFGGFDPLARNVISGHTRVVVANPAVGNGVLITGETADSNRVAGNYIGTGVGGSELGFGNGADGVRVAAGADTNTVGGDDDDDGAADTTVNARNVIANNGSDGVEINGLNVSTTANVVAGNRIGTDKDGVDDLGNTANGVFVTGTATTNTIGGSTSTPGTDGGNVISGNNGDGVRLTSNADSNLVRGNLIGLRSDGVGTIPNVGDGARLSGVQSCIIGGATADLRNVISGNLSDGVELNEGQNSVSDSNTVAGNYVGTDITGTGDLGNANAGVRIDGGDVNTIGGLTATPGDAPGNVISGNNTHGVELADLTVDNTNSNLIRGNLIGLRVGGTQALPNAGDGVHVGASVEANTVGGALSGARNVISGNAGDGIDIASTGQTVQGNYVGTQADGATALANAGHGILINASNTAVGGTLAGAPNLLAFNGGDGVYVQTGTGNAIRQNSIHSNTGLGIDLGTDGITPNDTDDPDIGANNLINFPVITDARTGSTIVTGTLNATPNNTYTLDFFSSPAPDPTGAGEGQTFLESRSVTTDGGGDAAFSFTLTATAPLGHVITATTTSTFDNTSEFSAAHVVLAPTLSRLREFEAALTDGGVALSWRTELEVDNLGFRLYREEAGERTLITPSLVAGSALAVAPGTVLTAGGSYSWTDASGTPASRYWLEDVDTEGVATLHGPFWATHDLRRAPRPKKSRPSALLEQVGASRAGTSQVGEVPGSQNPQRGWAAQVPVEGRSVGAVSGRSGVGAAGPASAATAGPVVIGPPVKIVGGAPAPGPNQRVLAGGPAVKLSVRRPGWYRVTRAQLEAAGLSPSADPVRLQLFAEGVEQAIHVNPLTWAAGGALEFYGEGLDTLSADTRVYWLVEGATAGRRTSVVSFQRRVGTGGRGLPILPGGPLSTTSLSRGTLPPTAITGGGATPTGFDYTVERRDRNIYFSALLNGERSNFFGGVITPGAPAQVLTVRGLRAEGAGPARLELALQGLTAGTHSVRVTLNGVEVGTLVYVGRENKPASFDVSPTLLREGDNEVGLNSAAPSDVSLTEYVRLTYRRAYRAEADRLSFTAEAGAEARVSGFTTPHVRVVDVTEPASVTEVVALVEPALLEEGGGYAVRFTPVGAGRRTLLAFGEPAVSAVDQVRANRPSGLYAASNTADFVIITHADFRAAADTLAARRSSEGLATLVIDVEDIYDEFSFGAHSPAAVRDFLSRARTSWRRAPRYVLLVGDGSYDPRGHLGRGAFDFVPARLIDTVQMETSSDEWLADFNGDGLAEMSVGRLPVRTAAEAALVVSKIVGHAPGSTERRLLLVSDRTGADGFDFEAATSSLLAHVPATYEAVRINRGARDAATVRAEIVVGVNNGPALVNYVGHGSLGVWTGEGILRTADALALSNGTRLPLFAMMTCLNGYYIDPSLDSLSESLVKAEHGGALAAWSSTGMTTPDAQAEMNSALYRALFQTRGPLRLGDALRAARSSTSDPDVRRTWVLVGDPTTRWR